MHDSRSTHRFHGSCNPGGSDFWSQLSSRALCIFVRSFFSPSYWPFASSSSFHSLPTKVRKKIFPHLSSPWPNHPIYLFLRLMIEFRLARVVTYILAVLCRPVSISIPVGLGRRVAGAERIRLSLIIARKSFCFDAWGGTWFIEILRVLLRVRLKI